MIRPSCTRTSFCVVWDFVIANEHALKQIKNNKKKTEVPFKPILKYNFVLRLSN